MTTKRLRATIRALNLERARLSEKMMDLEIRKDEVEDELRELYDTLIDLSHRRAVQRSD